MRWLIKRTTTETFEVNIDALEPLFPDGGSMGLDRVLGMGGGPMARDAENWIIAQFELHDGSQYGDKVFSSCANQDTGYELVCEEN